MREDIKEFVESWLPPGLLRLISLKKGVRWSGNYTSWEEALRVSTGYNSKVVLNKVKDSLLKVKNGEAVYERDSVLFDEILYSWPILAGLMWIAAQSSGVLNLIDIGGSLGSTYFQNRKFLESLKKVSWTIVEQKHFVETGKIYFQTEMLGFSEDLEKCFKETSPKAILLSSVLQYLEAPYDLLRKITDLKIEFILFDRTSFIFKGPDRLTVQNVPHDIYKASYPCWFFNMDKFLSFFRDDYDLISEFDALAGKIRIDGKIAGIDKGFIIKKKSKYTS